MSLGRGDAGDSWLPALSSLAIALAFASLPSNACALGLDLVVMSQIPQSKRVWTRVRG